MLLNQRVFTCEEPIQCVFFGSFTFKMNVLRLVFNNKNEMIQTINSKSKTLKICDNTKEIENSFNLNL